jgi:hypothetical protein
MSRPRNSDRQLEAKVEEKVIEKKAENEAERLIANEGIKTPEQARADAEKAEKEKSDDPKTYIADRAVYLGGVLTPAGDPFTTNEKPEAFWTEIDPMTMAAIDASSKLVQVQPSLDELGEVELRALAATKNIETTVGGKQLGKDELLTAIKAAYEPKL